MIKLAYAIIVSAAVLAQAPAQAARTPTTGVRAPTAGPTPAPVQAAVYQFTADLNGYNETNGSGTFNLGDPDGAGTALLSINAETNTIDWTFTVSGIDTITNAHIHPGNANSVGSPVVAFGAALSGTGLFDADLASVLANPGNFYVNLHNTAFPGGAIRGQITPVPEPATVGMMLAGLGLVGWRLRSRSL